MSREKEKKSCAPLKAARKRFVLPREVPTQNQAALGSLSQNRYSALHRE